MSLKLYAPHISVWKETDTDDFNVNVILPKDTAYVNNNISFTPENQANGTLEIEINLGTMPDPLNGEFDLYQNSHQASIADFDTVEITVINAPDSIIRKIKAPLNDELEEGDTPKLQPHVYLTKPGDQSDYSLYVLVPNNDNKEFEIDRTVPSTVGNNKILEIIIATNAGANPPCLITSHNFSLETGEQSVTEVHIDNDPPNPKGKQIIRESDADDKDQN